ncbi:hypothetical protein AWH62_09520 [Maricaulis sp. W15]|uniref:Uncharacterized protein n=1 Tax=Maricaulis maris TaxID=74318 RepID=A0A495DKI4_9PROT|nr:MULTISPECIES: hypothetical protein [Maricaulis]OLF73168.1 hypothetical protein AWH62_09520 [Maricaulis sp. W15]RKR03119.1 hypothetical protein C7435_1067 [Maricaulis maris]
MRRKIRPGHDLFGHPLPGTLPLSEESDRLSRALRGLSEDAFHHGYGQSACLIELAANYIEMESARLDQLRRRR